MRLVSFYYILYISTFFCLPYVYGGRGGNFDNLKYGTMKYICVRCISSIFLNPFDATDIFWYPLKTSENQRFSNVFRGYRNRSVAWNELIIKILLSFPKRFFFFHYHFSLQYDFSKISFQRSNCWSESGMRGKRPVAKKRGTLGLSKININPKPLTWLASQENLWSNKLTSHQPSSFILASG